MQTEKEGRKEGTMGRVAKNLICSIISSCNI